MNDTPAPLPAFRIDVGAAELKRALDVLDPLTSEALLRIGADGITCASIDPAHVAIEVVRLDRSLFFGYELDRPGSVGVDLVRLRELLKIPRGEPSYKATARKEAVFTLSVETTPGGTDRLSASLTTPGGAQIVRTMSVIDPSGFTEPKVPPHEPTARAEDVDTEAFYSTVTGAAKAEPAGGLRLNRSKAGVWLRTVPKDDGTTGSESEVSCLTLTGAGRAEYPLDFLGKVAKALRGTDSLSLLWSRDRPLKVGFRWGPSDRPTVDGYYLIAARVDDEQYGLSWYDHAWTDWYDWAMPGPRDRLAPDPSAACVDSVPTDVIDAEIARVLELGAAQMAAYETALEMYPARAETVRLRAETYETFRAGFVARWRETHKRDPAERTIRATVGFRPHETIEPPERPAAPEPFSDPDRREPYSYLRPHRYANTDPAEYDREMAKYTRDTRRHRRAEARELRGRRTSGIGWGPARPAPAQEPTEPAEPFGEFPVTALEAPEPRPEPGPTPDPTGTFAGDPSAGTWYAVKAAPEPSEPAPAPVEPAPRDPEVSQPVPTAEDGPEGPPARPLPVGQMGDPRPVGFRTPEEVRALTGRPAAPSRRRRADRSAARTIAAQITPPAPPSPGDAGPSTVPVQYDPPAPPVDPEPVMGDPLPTELPPVDPAPAPAVAPVADPAAAAPARPGEPAPVDRHGRPRLTRGFMRRDWRTRPPGRSARAVRGA